MNKKERLRCEDGKQRVFYYKLSENNLGEKCFEGKCFFCKKTYEKPRMFSLRKLLKKHTCDF